MQRLVYLSEALVDFSDAELDALQQQAASKNEQLDITGYLYFRAGSFVQYVEGERVAELLDTLRLDPRHQILNVLNFDDDDHSRLFPLWSMRWLTDTALVGVHLEDVLRQQMNALTRTPGQAEVWSNLIWLSVESIARVQSNIR